MIDEAITVFSNKVQSNRSDINRGKQGDLIDEANSLFYTVLRNGLLF